MLNKQLHKHIDVMDEIETKAQKAIDNLIDSIDIDEVMANPHKAMKEAADEIKEIMTEKYIEAASLAGINLARLLDKYDAEGKEITIDPSNDPKENEEIV